MTEIIFNKVGRFPQVIEDRACIYVPLLGNYYGLVVGGSIESLKDVEDYLSNFGISKTVFDKSKGNYLFRSCIVDKLKPIKEFPGDVFDSDILIPFDVNSKNQWGLLNVVLNTAFTSYRDLSEDTDSYDGKLSFSIDLEELGINYFVDDEFRRGDDERDSFGENN